MTPKERKTLRNVLKNEATMLLNDVMQSLKQRSINKYADDIKYTDNVNSIRKIIRELTLISEASQRSPKKEFSKSSLKVIRQENKEIQETMSNMTVAISKRRSYSKQVLNGAFKEFYIYADEIRGYNMNSPIEDIKNSISKIPIILSHKLLQELKLTNSNQHQKQSIKAFIVIVSILQKKDDPDEIKEHYFNSPMRTIISPVNIQEFINDVFNGFFEALTIAKNSSDWIFKEFVRFTIATNTHKSVLGRSYIKLPDSIANKKACVNIKNTDERCFDYCLIASRIYDMINSKDKNAVYNYSKNIYPNSDDKNKCVIEIPKNIKYPITTDNIQSYEELNNMQINVFELDPKFNPHYIDENDDDDDIDIRNYINIVYKSNQHKKEVVNLLLLSDGDKSHYVLIRSLSRLFASKKSNRTKYFCPNCITKSFLSCELLEKHVMNCANYSESERKECDIVCKLPEEGDESIMKFKHDNYTFYHPFHVIADFESTLVPYDEFKNSNTTKYQKHVPNSYGLKYCSIHKDYDEDVEIFNSNNPEEVCKSFIEKLEEYAIHSYELTQLHKSTNDIIISIDDAIKHNIATHCENCKMQFTCEEGEEKRDAEDKENQVIKVMHHDHITGNFISSLCSKCNFKFQYRKFLPVYIHNLKGYDAHLFINSLYKYGQTERDVSCIPNNEERYISFSKVIKVGEAFSKKDKCMKPVMYEIRFLDTIAFMNSSIESLVNNLRKGVSDVNTMTNAFPNSCKHFTDYVNYIPVLDYNKISLMTTKGIYPYDYITSFDKMNDSKLPDKRYFYSKLYDSECTDEEYKQAQNVWKTFNCKTFLDYHNLYLKSDVLLLADVWESFRITCYENYGLDCTYYFTAPGLSFDAMLKHTKINLQLLTDIEMYEFCESGIRGGLSQISTRHAVANNKYISKKYDDKKDDSYIVYLDANNLYGWAMSQALPYANFKWNTEEWNKEKIMNITDDSHTGYKFKCHLRIPENLHDYFNNYVPCPDNVQVKKDFLSEWQQDGYMETKIRKLCCSFNDKIDYVVDYRYLKLALSLGVELVSVSKVLEYSQKPFLKDYIELNTSLRKKAKNDFEKDFFKLMNNAVFGKTMENVRARINFRLVTTDEQAWRVKNLNRFTIFTDSLVGVHIQKKLIELNKPVYLGQTILDDSKYLMYDFHYNFMLNKIPRNDIDLLFTDTDSLCYNIRKHDIFQIMKENKEYFDMSEYPKDSDMYDASNNKVIGKFKNESIKPITEFVGLRAKLYAYSVYDDNAKHLRCKGVKKCVAQRELRLENYRDILYQRNKKDISQNGIRSYGHQLYTETVNKTALSARDDKVYICDDNVHTFNFGHYKTKK